MNSVSPGTIIKYAQDMLDAVDQWKRVDAWLNVAAKYYNKAEALIELLEIEHCGSVGGYGHYKGKDQEHTKYAHDLKGRLAWLKRVYL